MNPNNMLPLLLLLVSALPIALALAGLLLDERAPLRYVGHGPAAKPVCEPTPAPRFSRLSVPGASATVAGSRRREVRAKAIPYFPQAAQGSLAIAN